MVGDGLNLVFTDTYRSYTSYSLGWLDEQRRPPLLALHDRQAQGQERHLHGGSV